MSYNETALYYSNGYNALAACEHCEGIIRYERWCQTVNPVVCYACKIVVSADELAIGDAIILHSLGVLWGPLPHLNSRLRLALKLNWLLVVRPARYCGSALCHRHLTLIYS